MINIISKSNNMSKSIKRKIKNKGSSIKKWKGVRNEGDTFWYPNSVISSQNSPKSKNRLNTTAPINFNQLGMNQYLSGKGFKDSSVKLQAPLEKTMSFGNNKNGLFSTRYDTYGHGGKINSNSIVATKTKKGKFKSKISSNRGSTKPSAVLVSHHHRKNTSIYSHNSE